MGTTLSSGQKERQNREPDLKTLITADQGHQGKQCEPTRSMPKLREHSAARLCKTMCKEIVRKR